MNFVGGQIEGASVLVLFHKSIMFDLALSGAVVNINAQDITFSKQDHVS